MATAVIGRILATSLYQAITEQLPLRVDFYESWLSPKGFAARRAYVSGVRAVFSFLRREAGGYDAVVRRAGELAADWLFDDLPPLRRRLILVLPRALRVRAALALATALVRETWNQSRVKVEWRSEVSTLTITGSLFCDARAASPAVLCGYYAAGLEACLRRLHLDGDVRIDACAAKGDDGCRLSVTSRRQAPEAAPAVLLAVVLAGGLAATVAAQTPGVSSRVLVMPFENASKQARLTWLKEGASILLTGQLDALGVTAMSRDERLRAFDRFQLPPRASLSRATVIRIGALVGAADVVVGSFDLEADELVLRARRIRLGAGRLGAEASVRGVLGETADLFAHLAAQLWAGDDELAGRGDDAGASREPRVPMAAFEPYVKGLLADTPAAQVPLFTKAIQIKPDYAEARIALAQARSAAENYRGAIDALAPIGGASPRWVEAMILTAVAQLELRDYPAAWKTLGALRARAPSALVLNDMGVVRLRTAAPLPGSGRATWYFSQARMVDPLDPDYLFNLGYAYWLEGDPSGAGFWLREAVPAEPDRRRGPRDARAGAARGRARRRSGTRTGAGAAALGGVRRRRSEEHAAGGAQRTGAAQGGIRTAARPAHRRGVRNGRTAAAA